MVFWSVGSKQLCPEIIVGNQFRIRTRNVRYQAPDPQCSEHDLGQASSWVMIFNLWFRSYDKNAIIYFFNKMHSLFIFRLQGCFHGYFTFLRSRAMVRHPPGYGLYPYNDIYKVWQVIQRLSPPKFGSSSQSVRPDLLGDGRPDERTKSVRGGLGTTRPNSRWAYWLIKICYSV